MKYTIIFFIATVLASAIMAGGEPGDEARLDYITGDTTIGGFYMAPIRILNPFSPVFYVEFNLPESSVVSLFVIDTLKSDTSWFCRQESLAPGLYNTRDSLFIEFMKQFPIRAELHILVTSRYGKDTGFPIDCTYEAIRRM